MRHPGSLVTLRDLEAGSGWRLPVGLEKRGHCEVTLDTVKIGILDWVAREGEYARRRLPYRQKEQPAFVGGQS